MLISSRWYDELKMILASPRLLLLIKGLKYPCFYEKRYFSRWRMFSKFIWKTMPDLLPLFKRLVLNVIGLVLSFVIYTFPHNAWITCRILYFFLLLLLLLLLLLVVVVVVLLFFAFFLVECKMHWIAVWKENSLEQVTSVSSNCIIDGKGIYPRKLKGKRWCKNRENPDSTRLKFSLVKNNNDILTKELRVASYKLIY